MPFLAEDYSEEPERDSKHDKPSYENASNNSDGGFLKIKVQNTCGEGARPGTSARNRDSDK